MQVMFYDKDELHVVGEPTRSRPKKKHKEPEEGGKVYLEFRFCKNRCFNCKQCDYFWGQGLDKEELRGKTAHFGCDR